ncbi:DUF222 domain-containing protein [Knoellia sp. S7-12]|uniref:HNH endonuclease signature motif containing protein n=1 Tax=Knoellia sp. S7-12 TaxID=3126698 RepID=UPI003366D569
MTTATELTYADCVDRLRAAQEAAAALPSVVWQATGAELGAGLQALGELSAVAEGAEAAITIDALDRGEPAASNPPVNNREWVMHHHRRYAVAGAGTLATVADACRDSRHTILRDAVTSGRVSIATAMVILKEMRLLKPHLNPDAVDTVWHAYMTLGERHDARTVRRLRDELLARHGHDGEFDDTEDRAKKGESLTLGKEIAPGLWEYVLRITREGRACLEAAIGPLTAPTPTPADEHGPAEPDLRPHDLRRAHALLAVIGRAQKAGDKTWSSTKAQIFVQITLEDLQNKAGAGSLLGGLTTGELVTPDTVRRWACDATIIPTLLNTCGEAVDLGRAERFFTPAQIKRLWLRDRHCTYPGCDAPAAWTDAHHLIHWADGGPSDLTNAALLCQRHHTTVHSQRYHGWIETDPHGRQHVVWDRTRGAYDHALTRLDTGRGLDRDGPTHPSQRPSSPTAEAIPRASGDDNIWHRQ